MRRSGNGVWIVGRRGPLNGGLFPSSTPLMLRWLPLLLVLAACRPAPPEAPFALTDAPLAAAPGSGRAHLFADGDRVILSWTEPVDSLRHALRFATWTGDAWSTPQTVIERDSLFVNWADFPSLLALDDGRLAAHLLVRSGAAPYAYDVHVTQSTDGGATWSNTLVPHTDGTQTEHGFVSLLPWPGSTAGDRVGMVWLDGRNTGGGHGDAHGGGAMTLRFASLDADGTLHDEAELDDRICDCCGTAAVRTSDGAVAFYRDRSADEVRDVAFVRFDGTAWSAPRPLGGEGWVIDGCPVNGPAAAADGDRIAVAYFTAANDTPAVRVAFSDDGGRTFGAPVTVDDDAPLGRVDVALLPDGSAFVLWLSRTPETPDESSAALRAQRLYADGRRASPVLVTPTSGDRRSGFPQLARHGNHLFFAWTALAADGSTYVRTAVGR